MAYTKTNWSSTTPINIANLNKIEDGIGANDNARIYSTTETVVGTWIDGKPLYRKVIQFSITSVPTYYNLSSYITNPEVVMIDMGHTMRYWNTSYFDRSCVGANYYSSSSDFGRIFIDGSQRIAFEGANGNYIVTLEYTKTTD